MPHAMFIRMVVEVNKVKLSRHDPDNHRIKQATLEQSTALEPIRGDGIIRTYGPITIPRIPLVQWVQHFREIARPGTCESIGFFFVWPQWLAAEGRVNLGNLMATTSPGLPAHLPSRPYKCHKAPLISQRTILNRTCKRGHSAAHSRRQRECSRCKPCCRPTP